MLFIWSSPSSSPSLHPWDLQARALWHNFPCTDTQIMIEMDLHLHCLSPSTTLIQRDDEREERTWPRRQLRKDIWVNSILTFLHFSNTLSQDWGEEENDHDQDTTWGVMSGSKVCSFPLLFGSFDHFQYSKEETEGRTWPRHQLRRAVPVNVVQTVPQDRSCSRALLDDTKKEKNGRDRDANWEERIGSIIIWLSTTNTSPRLFKTSGAIN